MADNLKITLEKKDVSDDNSALAELLEKGGKKQVPFLVDDEKGESMYETSDIIDYLRTNYAGSGDDKAEAGKPRIHMGDSTCVSCEG